MEESIPPPLSRVGTAPMTPSGTRPLRKPPSSRSSQRSRSPSRGNGDGDLMGSRSATKLLPAEALSPKMDTRRSASRQGSRREKSLDRAEAAEAAAAAAASLEDHLPSGLQHRDQPDEPLPEQILFERLSYVPLKRLDLSHWTEHIWPSELQRVLQLNSTWNTLAITDCDTLDDPQTDLLLSAFGPRITYLDLSSCPGFTDATVKKAMNFCSALGDLHIRDCPQLTDRSLRSIATSGLQLHTLNIVNCLQVGDHAFTNMVAACPQLTDIDVSGCKELSDRSFKDIGKKLSLLTRTGLNRCPKLTDEGLLGLLTGPTKLESLRALECTNITDVGARALYEVEVMYGFRPRTGCDTLLQLELSNNSTISDGLTKWLWTGCANLRYLNLESCLGATVDDAMAALAKLDKIEWLSLANAQGLSDQGCAVLGSAPQDNLTHLNLSGCENITDEGIRALTKAYRKLRFLDVSWIPETSDSIIQPLTKNCPRISVLKLCGSRKLTDRGIGLLTRRNRIIVDLDLRSCVQLTHRALRDVATLRNLEILNISSCAMMSDSLFKLMPRDSLQVLRCANLAAIGDDGLRMLTETTCNLRELDVSGCACVTAAGIEYVVKRYRHLRSLETTIDQADLQQILNNYEYFDGASERDRDEWSQLIGRAREGKLAQHGHPFLCSGASASAGSGGNITGNQSPRFRGLRFSNETRSAKARQDCFERWNDFDKAASKIQKGMAYIEERRQAARNAANTKREKAVAIMAIQLLIKGLVARRKFQKIRQNKAVAAGMMQAMFRLKKLRRQWRAADVHFRSHVLSAHFIAFKNWYIRNRTLLFGENPFWVPGGTTLRPLHACDLTVEEKERADRGRVMFWYKLMFGAWFTAVFRDVEDVAKEKKAICFWEEHYRPVLFLRWRTNARIFHKTRRQLAILFMLTVKVETHNSSRQLFNRARADAYRSRMLFAWIWIGLRETSYRINKDRRNQEKALAFSQKIFRQGPLSNCLGSLRMYKDERRLKAMFKRNAIAFREKATVKATVHFLHDLAEKNKDFRAKAEKAMKLWRNGIMHYIVSTWKEYVVDNKWRRKQRADADIWCVVESQRRRLLEWRQFAVGVIKERLRRQRMLEIAKNFYSNQVIMVPFKAWKMLAANAGNEALFAENKAKTKLKKEVMMTWKTWLKKELYEKEQLRKKEELWRGAATKVQSVMRMFLGKKKFARYKNGMGWGVVKVQAQARMKSAINLANKLRLMRDLKLYVGEEKETDLMEIEDTHMQLIVKLTNTSIKLQSWARGCLDRWYCVSVRIEYNKGRMRRWLIDQERRMTEAEEAARRREEQLKEEERQATNIQRYYRALLGRKRFKFIHAYRMETNAAVTCQRIYRGRRGRRVDEATRRSNKLQKHHYSARRFQGKFLRLLSMKSRRSQRAGLYYLRMVGLDVTSFMTDWRMNLGQVAEDFYELYKEYHEEILAWKEQPPQLLPAPNWNKHKRHQSRIRIRQEGDKTKIFPYDAVKVIGNLKEVGFSGYIMSIDKSTPGRPLAEMSMDGDGRLAYIPVTAEDGETMNLYGIDKMVKKKAMPNLKRMSRRHMLMWAKREAPRWETFLAARTIQMAGRKYISYRRVARVRFRYWKRVKERRLIFLQTLGSFGFNWHNTANTLIRYGVADGLSHEKFDELPVRIPMPPKLREELERRRHRILLYREFRRKVRERRKYQNDYLFDNKEAMNSAPPYLKRPVRRLVPLNYNISRQMIKIYKPTIWQVADAIMPAQYTRQKGEGMQYFIASLVGGSAWQRTEDELKTWSGRWGFPEFELSPHCRICNTQVFHGCWDWNKPLKTLMPHGEGCMEMLQGYGVAREEKVLKIVVIKARGLKAMDSNGFSDPYVMVECNGKKFRTPYVTRNLNPLWHEVFEIDVTDPDTHVQFSVWDYDVLGSNDYMGGINVDLMELKAGIPIRKWYKLKDYDRGILVPGWGTNKGKGRKAKFGELELQLVWSEREQSDDVQINRARFKMSVVLQSWARHVLSKMALLAVREERRQDLEMIRIMVTKMQNAWRGRVSRRELRRRKRRWAKAIVCQMALRRYNGRKELASRRVRLASALVMAAAARRRLAYVNVFQRRLMKLIYDHLAIITLQCMARQRIARRALALKREELIDEGVYRPLLMLEKEDGTPSKKYDMEWFATYGRDEEFGSKRLARISYRGLTKLLAAPGPKAIVVTSYGNADINEYPLPDEGMTTFDEEIMDDAPLRLDTANMVRVLMHGYCDMPLPLEQRLEVKKTAPKHMMVLRMKSVLCRATMNRYCTFVQCAYRQRVAWKEYAIRKRLWDLATRIERFYKKRFAKRVECACLIQTRVRMMEAKRRLVYKQMELAKAIMIQCRWRQVRAKRRAEDQRTIPTVSASATSSDFNPTFSGDQTLDENPVSFWCSAEGQTKSQWIMYDLGRKASIGILRIICPVDASAPKHVSLQTADNPFDDFVDLARFELHNRNSDIQSVYIKERRVARFWRFYVRKNHGSKSSVSVNFIKFLVAPESSVHIVENPKTVSRDPGPFIGHRDDDIVLTCKGDAWPLPTYQWRQNGRDLEGETDRILRLKVQKAKSRKTKKYRCTHCRKVRQDLPKNIYKCLCKNCGWEFAFPEQIEANKLRLYITEQDSKLSFVLDSLRSIEEAVNENITTMKRQLLSEQLLAEQKAAKAGGGMAKAADNKGKPQGSTAAAPKKAPAVVEEENSDDEWDDDVPKDAGKVTMWEDPFLVAVKRIPHFVDDALSPSQVSEEADEDAPVLRPCDVLATHVEKFNGRRRKMDKRDSENKLRGLDLQLEFISTLREKTLLAQEVLVYEKLANSRLDPVHQKYSCEGIFTCVITNLRGATVNGEGGRPIEKETKPCAVLVGDPRPQLTKVTNDYTPKVYTRRKKFPKYMSIHCFVSWGHLRGDVVIRYNNGHVYAGPYVEEKWLNADGNTEHRGREKDHWGTWITTDDHIYEGLIVDNHLDMRCVIGDFRVTYPNAEIFEGQYLDNHRHGVGEYSYLDGCLYEGEFYIGVRQGFGVLRSPNGAIYEGEWDHDTIHGEGLWSWPDGSSYMGASVNGMRTGKGLYCNKDGGMYYGDFLDNLIQGNGIFNYVDNSRYEGGWKNNQRDGKAVFTDPRGVRYIGTYRDDMRHGEFIVRRPTLMPGYQEGYAHGEGDVFEDEVQKGLWENGKFVMWLSEPVSPLATLQFIDRFEDEDEYDGTYALMIAKRLPRLPHGVQADHELVIPIIERIRNEGGSLVATETYAETLRKIHELEPVLEYANKDNQNAQTIWETQVRARNVSFEVKESCRQDLEKYEQRLKEILSSIELFFADDPEKSREDFQDVVKKINKLTPKDCFEIRQHNDPSPVLEKAMNAACQLCLSKTDWKSAQMLLATSQQNKEDGDTAAAYVEYDVKLQYLLNDFDVWKRCDMHSMLGSVAGILTDPRMKPNHFSVKSYGKALVRIVDFIWKALVYIRRAKGVLKKKNEQDATIAMIARARTALDGAEAALGTEEARVRESKRLLDEATRVRDFHVRRMKELQAMLKQCREMIVEYMKPEDHELDVYEQQEKDHDATDRQQVVIVMEMLLTNVEKRSDPYPEIDEDPILDIIEEAVPRFHQEMFYPEVPREDGEEGTTPPYYYDAGELLPLVAYPPVAEDKIQQIVENLKMRINAVLNMEPDDEHWAMQEDKRRENLNERTRPGEAPVYTVELLYKIVRKKWANLTEFEANSTSAETWQEAMQEESARKAVDAKYNIFLAERPRIEAGCWRAIHKAELQQTEEIMAIEFEQKYSSNTGQEAIRLSADMVDGNIEDFILAKNWVWVHPELARKARDDIELELSKQFVKAYPEETQDHAARVTIDGGADPLVKSQAEAWAARHVGMFAEGMKKIGADASEEFQEKFSSDTAITAVRAIESLTAPLEIKRNAAAWGAANKSEFNIAKAEYLKEQQKKDESLVDKIMMLKKALAPHVETIQKAALEDKPPALNVDGTEALQRLKDNFQARLDYNQLRYDEIKVQLDALENDTTYRVVSKKMRPSEAQQELKDRAWNRERRLEILKKGEARYTEIINGIMLEREVFFPTPPPPEVEVVDGWEHHWDEESQAWYWLSQETGEAVWEEAAEEDEEDEEEGKKKKKKKKKDKDKKDKKGGGAGKKDKKDKKDKKKEKAGKKK